MTEKDIIALMQKGRVILDEAKVLYEIDELDSLLMAALLHHLPPVSSVRVVKILKGLAHIIEQSESLTADIKKAGM